MCQEQVLISQNNNPVAGDPPQITFESDSRTSKKFKGSSFTGKTEVTPYTLSSIEAGNSEQGFQITVAIETNVMIRFLLMEDWKFHLIDVFRYYSLSMIWKEILQRIN